jgi:L,D-transpeptidase catalytic domain/Sporulation and spore germination/Putative peptidoglycan binding domain
VLSAMSARGLPLVVALAGLVAVLVASASAATASSPVEVTFVRNGKLARVERVVPSGARPAAHALRELLQGPTRIERAKGMRSAFRDGVRLRSVRARGDVWLVRLSRSALGPATGRTIETRFRQISATLARLGPEKWAVISTEGRFATELAVGVRPSPWRATSGEKGYAYAMRGVQLRLFTLGYLDRSSVTGSTDYETEQALLAFQGWNGLGRTGTVTGETQLALFRASSPRPASHRPGRRVEIYRERGVVLLVDGNEVRRAVHTSTGAFGRTPSGSFHVFRQETLSWSRPFSVWMPYASYFVGGIAMHEYPDVPDYPASHGCVRLPAGEAQRVFAFVDVGTPVFVF